MNYPCFEKDRLIDQTQNPDSFSDIVGSGAAMQKVYRLMSLVADSNSTVLLTGETGTGKELVARAIHEASPRKNKSLIKVNCAALPANLVESELFGHERGAFTGATDRRVGKFELANNGTIFLDEIGEIPLDIQVKLLRVLQEREFERIGGKQTIKTDVRIIAATNRNLESEVKAGRFRSDLFYRLNVFPIQLPPLRDRKEDIPPLACFFLNKYNKSIGKRLTGISTKLISDMQAYHWPGNVRELEHLMERSILLAAGPVLQEMPLPDEKLTDEKQTLMAPGKPLHEMERTYIIDALKRSRGKIGGLDGAAQVLAIPATTLHSKIRKLGITKSEYLH